LVPFCDLYEISLYSKIRQPELLTVPAFNIGEGDIGLAGRAVAMMCAIMLEYLLAKKEYIQIIALSEQYIAETQVYPNLFAEIKIRAIVAAAFEKLGKRGEATEQMLAALRLAVPDMLLMPFVEVEFYVPELLKSISKSNYTAEIGAICAIADPYNAQIRKIIQNHYPTDDLGLTPRELEIAKMAAQRLSNGEIAEALYISENTVKTLLSRVFSKLDIQKRYELGQYF
jgi:LuxR family maltose regulon positive regulatory protein